jgi:hypothetical protein
LREDCRNRAGRHARVAVDALDRIDKQLIGLGEAGFVLLGVDAIDRTSVYAGGVLGADTGFSNDVCHRAISPEKILRPRLFSVPSCTSRR